MKADQIIIMLEEYFTRMKLFKTGTDSVEIFVNPSNREIQKDLGNEVKFVADLKTKEIYVWAEYGPLHQSFWQEKMHRNLYSDVLSKKAILGYADKISGKLVMSGFDGAHFMEELFVKVLATTDAIDSFIKSLSWINRYVDTKKLMAERKKELLG
jgi:hypothetical protein